MNDVITHNQIKYIKSLHQSKFRQKYNNFIAEGDKIAEEILQNSIYKIEGIFATEKWINKNDQFAHKHKQLLTRPDICSSSNMTLNYQYWITSQHSLE